MESDKSTRLNTTSSGGASGTIPESPLLPFQVGPSTGSEFNRIKLQLIPVACWGVEDVRFAFDSSFVGSDATGADTPEDIRAEFAHLTSLIDEHPSCPLSVFGHADPVGTDVYNKALSGRRATSIYALLIFNTDPDSAVQHWHNIAVTEKWSSKHRQAMLDLTKLPSNTSDLSLMRAYMQQLCFSAPKLAKTDFLARGADPQGKGDLQGCSEFNPRILFSSEKKQRYKDGKANNDAAIIAERNADNAPNRRVMVLLFRRGSRVDPQKWPCPAANDDGISGCTKRFWSDGEQRRNQHPDGVDRRFDETKDTFACRFYQRISQDSPCDNPRKTLVVWLLDDYGQRVPAGTPYRIRMASTVRQGTLKTAGLIVEPGMIDARTVEIEWGTVQPQSARNESVDQYLKAFVDARVPDHPFITGTIPVQPKDGMLLYHSRIALNSDHNDIDSPEVLTLRLGNLGYHHKPSTDSRLNRLKTDYEDEQEEQQQLKTTLRDIHRDGTEMPLKPFVALVPGPLPTDDDGIPIKQCPDEDDFDTSEEDEAF